MIPDLIAARSLRAFAIGARQFVVQEAAEMMQDGEGKTEEMERLRPIEPTVTAPSVSTSAAQTDRPLESSGQSISATQPSMDGLPPSLAEKVFIVRPKI